MDPSIQTTGSHKIQTLEQKYIALLESRIQNLEAVNAKEDKNQTTNEKNGSPIDTKGDSTIASPIDSADNASQPLVRLRKHLTKKNGVEEEQDFSLSDTGVPITAPSSTRGGNKTSKSPITWTMFMNAEGIHEESEFVIRSPELRALLSIVLAAYPGLHILPPSSPSSSDDIGWDSIGFFNPFEPLIHNWDKLVELVPNHDSAEETAGLRELRETIANIAHVDSSLASTDENMAIALKCLGEDNRLETARTHLDALLTHVKLAPGVKKSLDALDSQKKAKTVQFEQLWTIFPPGEIVYSTLFMNEPQLFVVRYCRKKDEERSPLSGSEEKRDEPTWELVVWAYDWSGSSFRRAPIRFNFPRFSGHRAISTLHCHPLRYNESADGPRSEGSGLSALEQTLLERGKRFKELCIKPQGSQMFLYEGSGLSHGTGFHSLAAGSSERDPDDERVMRFFAILGLPLPGPGEKSKQKNISGQVMVDFDAFRQNRHSIAWFGPMGSAVPRVGDDECRCSFCEANQALRKSQRQHYDYAKRDADFDDLQYMLCPPRVLGYHLGSKTWYELNVGRKPANVSDEDNRYLQDIAEPASKTAFDKLQLARTQKQLIKNLVESHTSGINSKHVMKDIIKEKGRGLVILLHGAPGVGKTLTAESVAQLAGKPLFSVGPSDIGLQPKEVEQNLETLFELAANWRAVLLFDEADVFLESRSSYTSDLGRNAVVSVLLRVLEYYDGILILTTNRIREFDVAVQSRVNLAIRYEDLDRDQKQAIFEGFVDQLDKESIIEKDGITSWFKEDEEAREWVKGLNGRQIRNILFSAMSIGNKLDGKLKLEDVKRMTKSTAMFQDSIKSIVEEARRKAEVGRQ